MYPFVNQDGKYMFNQTYLNATVNGGVGEGGTMYAYEDLDTSIVPYYIYVGMRLGELKFLGSIIDGAIAIGNGYIANMMNNRLDIPSQALVTTDTDERIRVEMNSTYVLPSAPSQNGKVFIGFKNTFDGKIYDAESSVTILMNTHFYSVWE